jgi:hypothetical protein
MPKPSMGPTQSPVQWAAGFFTRGKAAWNVKLTKSPTSRGEVKKKLSHACTTLLSLRVMNNKTFTEPNRATLRWRYQRQARQFRYAWGCVFHPCIIWRTQCEEHFLKVTYRGVLGEKKTVLVPLCPPQCHTRVAWDGTRDSRDWLKKVCDTRDLPTVQEGPFKNELNYLKLTTKAVRFYRNVDKYLSIDTA